MVATTPPSPLVRRITKKSPGLTRVKGIYQLTKQQFLNCIVGYNQLDWALIAMNRKMEILTYASYRYFFFSIENLRLMVLCKTDLLNIMLTVTNY